MPRSFLVKRFKHIWESGEPKQSKQDEMGGPGPVAVVDPTTDMLAYLESMRPKLGHLIQTFGMEKSLQARKISQIRSGARLVSPVLTVTSPRLPQAPELVTLVSVDWSTGYHPVPFVNPLGLPLVAPHQDNPSRRSPVESTPLPPSPPTDDLKINVNDEDNLKVITTPNKPKVGQRLRIPSPPFRNSEPLPLPWEDAFAKITE
ncbi:hypothetical protein Bbelb_111560 [Branchiostoma belcheri]|nr:hypothetical protein Bbelb_111560 [Branchiostoma belcheri]